MSHPGFVMSVHSVSELSLSLDSHEELQKIPLVTHLVNQYGVYL